jgi:hypothetical protein
MFIRGLASAFLRKRSHSDADRPSPYFGGGALGIHRVEALSLYGTLPLGVGDRLARISVAEGVIDRRIRVCDGGWAAAPAVGPAEPDAGCSAPGGVDTAAAATR